jgi:hypothetical protein
MIKEMRENRPLKCMLKSGWENYRWVQSFRSCVEIVKADEMNIESDRFKE